MVNCAHGFVVHNVLGAHRFLCRECDGRFVRHPRVMVLKPRTTMPCNVEFRPQIDELIFSKGDNAKYRVIKTGVFNDLHGICLMVGFHHGFDIRETSMLIPYSDIKYDLNLREWWYEPPK